MRCTQAGVVDEADRPVLALWYRERSWVEERGKQEHRSRPLRTSELLESFAVLCCRVWTPPSPAYNRIRTNET